MLCVYASLHCVPVASPIPSALSLRQKSIVYRLHGPSADKMKNTDIIMMVDVCYSIRPDQLKEPG